MDKRKQKTNYIKKNKVLFNEKIKPYLHLIFNESDEKAFLKKINDEKLKYKIIYNDEDELCVEIGKIIIEWNVYVLAAFVGNKMRIFKEEL